MTDLFSTYYHIDKTPRPSLSAALDALVDDPQRAAQLLVCERVVLRVYVVDPEPPAQACYQLRGTVCGRWHLALEMESRSAFEPAPRPTDPVWVTAAYRVEVEQPRGALRIPSAMDAIRADYASRRDPVALLEAVERER